MARVMVLFAHPGQRHSQMNRRLARAARRVDGVTFVDLYATYPQFKIDIDAEQDRLLDHDAVVMQFPIYWYSTPAILKEWQDLVLEFRWAYGPGGDNLKGKVLLPVVTAGGGQDAYRTEGKNHYPLRALLRPLEQTAALCQMRYLPPFALFAAHQARDDGRGDEHVERYRALLASLCEDRLDIAGARRRDLLSDGALPLREEA